MSEEETLSINITPKWTFLLKLYAEWFVTGSENQKELATKEFEKVGEILDGINEGKYILTEKEG